MGRTTIRILGLGLLAMWTWIPAATVRGADLTIYELQHHDAGHRVIDAAVVGEPIHPLVVFEEGDQGFPIGTVSFALYTGTSCTGTPVAVASRVAISSGVAHGTGATHTFQAEGWFCTSMSYAGDGNFNAVSAKIARQVLKLDPAVVTTVHDESHAAGAVVPLNMKVHLRVQVTGSDGQVLDGSVTLYHYVEANCGGVAYGTAVTLANGVVDGPGAIGYNAPITRSFRARFEGNPSYRALSGPCHNVRWLATPTMTVSGPHDVLHRETSQFEPDAPVHLRVVMSGAFGTPAGLGEIAAWKNSDCSGAPYATASGPLLDGIQDGNADVAFDTPGVASVRARYLGDSQYFGVEGRCIPLTIATTASTPPNQQPTSTPASAPTSAPRTGAPETGAPSTSMPSGGTPAPAESTTASAPGATATTSEAQASGEPGSSPLPVAAESPGAVGSAGDGGDTATPSSAPGGTGEPGTPASGLESAAGAAVLGLILLVGTSLVGLMASIAAVRRRSAGRAASVRSRQ